MNAARIGAILAWLGVLFSSVALAPAQTWIHISDIAPHGYTGGFSPSRMALACSADGGELVAADGPIFISRDSGLTWAQTLASTNYWQAVACSADGRTLVGANSLSTLANGYLGGGSIPGLIFVSTNSGTTWDQTAAPSNNWSSLTCSADGRVLVAADDGSGDGAIYVSTNSGTAWSRTTAPSNTWTCVTCSADGRMLVAASEKDPDYPGPGGDGLIYISTNSGAAWSQTTAPNNWWTSVASSADGTRLVAAGMVVDGSIYISANSGAHWSRTTAPGNYWWSVACSADGTKLVAGVPDLWYTAGPAYISTDSGNSWTATSTLGPYGLAASADGRMLFAIQAGEVYSTAYKGPGTLTGPESNLWVSVAASVDGRKLVAAAVIGGFDNFGPTGGGAIHISTNSGATWNPTTAPTNFWASVACSADGTRMVAVASGNPGDGLVYTSTNSGADWHSTSAPSNRWTSVASSTDGSKLVAANQQWTGSNYGPGLIYVSRNAGATWSPTAAPSHTWSSIACSGDGSVLVAASDDFPSGGRIYISTNSGAAWKQANVLQYNGWSSITCSSDGTKFVAAGDGIYISTNSGASWDRTTGSGSSVASSSDGTKLVAVVADSVYSSRDSGASWVLIRAPSVTWHAVASSADGNTVAAVGSDDTSRAGSIFTLEFPLLEPPQSPLPSRWLIMCRVGGTTKLSWLVSSTGVVLQQNSDLLGTNWTDLPVKPALDFTTLHYEVNVAPSDGSDFYRLKKQ